MKDNQANSVENETLHLLIDLQVLLAHALNSPGAKSKCSPAVEYLIWSARMVSETVTGYLCIRTKGVMMASKLLVRPILESTFYGTASVKSKEFLYRKAYQEWTEDNKLFGSANAEREGALAELKRLFSLYLSDYPIRDVKMTAIEAAKMAGLTDIYKDYRAYCQFTHGAIRATTGDLDEATNLADNRVVIHSVWKILEMLRDHTSADVQEMSQIRQRLVDLLVGYPGTH